MHELSRVAFEEDNKSVVTGVERSSTLNFLNFEFNNFEFHFIMSKETWKFIIQLIISILTAIMTTLGVTSCMEHYTSDSHNRTLVLSTQIGH